MNLDPNGSVTLTGAFHHNPVRQLRPSERADRRRSSQQLRLIIASDPPPSYSSVGELDQALAYFDAPIAPGC